MTSVIIKALERRLSFYERLTIHQNQFIKEHGLSSDFSVWLSDKVVQQGIDQ